MRLTKTLWQCFLLCLLTWCVCALGSELFEPPVAKVERTANGNIVLRCVAMLIYLHPNDFDTFSPHVSKWVKWDGYRENTKDQPPEVIKPGDIFSTSGIQLIEVLPDSPLLISVEQINDRYQVGETICVGVNLHNSSSEEVKFRTSLSDDPNFKSSVRIIVWVYKIDKWSKPRFYNLIHSKNDYIFLAPKQSFTKKDIDITALVDGPGQYRVSATYIDPVPIFSQFLEFTITPAGNVRKVTE